jgi:hypothetical protein
LLRAFARDRNGTLGDLLPLPRRIDILANARKLGPPHAYRSNALSTIAVVGVYPGAPTPQGVDPRRHLERAKDLSQTEALWESKSQIGGQACQDTR